MLRVKQGWRAALPSVIVVSLPLIWDSAAAADRVEVADGSGAWTVTIKPGPSKATDAVVQTAYQDEAAGPAVPQPVEAVAAEEPAAEEIENGKAAASACPPAFVDAASYETVYRSIPFRRSEYVANPSYRHEATMEILFGQLRPTVIHKDQPARTLPSLATAAPRPAAFPWTYDPYFGQVPTFFRNYAPTTFPLFY